MQSMEEFAPVECDSIRTLPSRQHRLELAAITLQDRLIHGEGVLPESPDGVGAEFLSDEVDCLAKRVSRVEIVEFRPKEREQCIPPDPTGWADAKEGQQCQSLLLPQNPRNRGTVGAAEIGGSQKEEGIRHS
jgi:hypothetical protein